jgi:hypothetical protein
MSQDAKEYNDWQRYEQYLNSIPRAERRRQLKMHADWIDKEARRKEREALKAKQPPADPADPFLKYEVR